jgi:hypothetical protein
MEYAEEEQILSEQCWSIPLVGPGALKSKFMLVETINELAFGRHGSMANTRESHLG